jgi:hypothetical protein
MFINDLIEQAPAVVSVIAAFGVALLVPLYLSQRRDVQRLREWMEREPDHPRADIAASEAILDRAEVELEELVGEPAPAEPATAVISAATRVTHERPALERITMERAALAPHPRWRRFVGRVTQPRVLVTIGIAALVLGVAGIVASQEILSSGDGDQKGGGAVDRAEVSVAVLNGTSINGLAGAVGSEVEANGYHLGAVTNTTPGVGKTEVMFADGEKAAAQKVARDLGLEPGDVIEVDRDARLLAGDADVVVIAGEDRAQR